MKILAVDTATQTCSVAITEDQYPIAEITLTRNQTHSKHLMDMIHHACHLSAIPVSDIDGFAITKGPGSFTGLRIGISTLKGLALTLKKPIVGISTLDALAFQFADSPIPVYALLDARKKEIYVSDYHFTDGKLISKTDEQVMPPEILLSHIEVRSLFVGDGALVYKSLIEKILGRNAIFPRSSKNIITASSVAFLSLKRFMQNDTDDIVTFVPRYIRKSDAEIKKNTNYPEKR